MLTADQLIENYSLQAHPEGGHYIQTYRSAGLIPVNVLPQGFGGDRYYSTAIYFLLEGNQFSTFHRIQSDELWHFYTGGGLNIFVLHPDGKGEVLHLGDDLSNGFSFQQLVYAGCWFAARPVDPDSFSFVGCTVAPGFDFADFEIAKRDELLKAYPQYEQWIHELTV